MLRKGMAAVMIALAFAVPAEPDGARAGGDRLAETVTVSEMKNLADALEICAIETSWYVGLEALNDSSIQYLAQPYDYINNGGGSYAIKPAEGRFRTTRINLLTGTLRWNGPYITVQAGRTQTAATPYDQGSPLDLWGTPYYLFTPYGLARGDNGTITQELYGDVFDRYAIVSLGPDGVMSGDDMAWMFGSGVSGFVLTSLRGSGVEAAYTPGNATWTAPAGTVLSIHGHNLGVAPADGKVFFNSSEVIEVPWTSWTVSAITVMLPARLAGQTGTLTAKRGTASSSALKVSVTASRNAAREWVLYE